MNRKRWGFLPIPLLVALIAVLHVTVDPTVFFDPGWLIPVTNTLFVTVVYLAVAYVALRNFAATGRIQIFLLGCGTLVFGLAAVCAAFARGLANGANLNVTIYNTGALAAALIYFVSAMLLVAGRSPTVEPARRRAWTIVGCLAAAIFIALLTTMALRGATPPFFVQGSGPTLLRQAVLGTADALFVFSFLIFIGTYFRTRETFLYWCGLAMALTAVSLSAFFIQSSVGSPVGWVGRISQYLGGIYLLVALVAAREVARERKTSFDNVLTFSLGPAEGGSAQAAAGSPGGRDRLDTELTHIYLEQSADAFYVKDVEGRYLLFNSEAARITGKRPDEVIGKDDYFLFPEAEAAAVMAGDRKVMKGGQMTTYEEVVQTVTGTTTYMATKGPLFDDDGKVVGLFGFARDITGRKRAEEALRESEQQYRGLFESSPVPVSLNEVICDAEGQPRDYRCLYVNSAYERFARARAAALVGRTAFEFNPRSDPATVERLGQVALTGVPDHWEAFSVRLDTYLEITAYSPRRGQFVSHFVDITERKHAEEQLAAQAARLKVLANVSRAFGEAGPDYRAVVDRVVHEIGDMLADSCQIRLLSDDGERMELVGNHARDPEMSQALRDLAAHVAVRTDDPGPVGRALSGDATLVSAVDPEELLASYPPELRPVLERYMPRSFILVPLLVDARAIGALSLTRYRDEEPPFTEVDLNLAKDLADRAALAISKARLMTQVQAELVERRAAEEQVRALNETLEGRVRDRTAAVEAANRELEAFSYSVSHDLRAPLRHIDGFGKVLLEEHADQLDPEGQRLLGRVVANSREMAILIDDLLAFSRVARKDLERRPVDMDRLARAVCADLGASEPERQIGFDVGSLGSVSGDQALLQQVWANLLGNAVKFTRRVERPQIEVRCERVGGLRRYTVRDDGAGFDPTYADKLFQPFQRLHQDSDFEGSGIGLAIVARIVQRHGGHVWAEGAPGAGATFGFSLPEEGKVT